MSIINLHGRGGGVCMYQLQEMPGNPRADFENPNYECMWLLLRPARLPRPLSGIAVCVVYNPPDRSIQEQRELCEYLSNTIDTINNKYPDCGIALMGDFNNLDISRLISNHRLKQVVSKPTRCGAIWDLIITNIHKCHEAPVITAPLGSSDHSTVIWSPYSTNSNRSN